MRFKHSLTSLLANLNLRSLASLSGQLQQYVFVHASVAYSLTLTSMQTPRPEAHTLSAWAHALRVSAFIAQQPSQLVPQVASLILLLTLLEV
jgi:hypothetical protein